MDHISNRESFLIFIFKKKNNMQAFIQVIIFFTITVKPVDVEIIYNYLFEGSLMGGYELQLRVKYHFLI